MLILSQSAIRGVISVLLVDLVASLSCLGQQPTPYYFFGKQQKIPLAVSSEYRAAWLTSDEAAAFRRMSTAKGRERQPEASLLLGNILLLRANTVQSQAAPFAEKAYKERSLPVFRYETILLIPTDEVIVKLLPDTSPGQTHELLDRYGRSDMQKDGSYIIRVKPISALSIANKLVEDSHVQYAEPNFSELIPAPPPVVPEPLPIVGASPVPRLPNDEYFPFQWSLENNGRVGRAGADIKVQPAWQVTKGDAVTIAILDLGVDVAHPDLKGKIVNPLNAINNTMDQTPSSPDDYHGTACAGLAAAVTSNGPGIAGVGWNTRIMPVKVATYDRGTNSWNTSARILARGIDAAVAAGADVLSNSWTFAPDSQVDAAIERALATGRSNRGALLVFAAGNSGGGVAWPASSASDQRPIVAVSATNEWDELKTWDSKDGETFWASNTGKSITVAAPGVHLFTTNLMGGSSANTGDYMPNFHGTSASTPIVAGVLALIVALNSGLPARDIVNRLTSNADDLGPPGRDDSFGFGRVNACRSVGAPKC